MTHSTPKSLAKWLLVILSGLTLPAWAANNVLEKVQVSTGQDNAQVIQATFKDAVATTPATFTTSNPQRLIIDFAKTGSAVGKQIEGASGTIRGIRVLESGDRTRMVLELAEPAQYEVRTERNKVMISVRDTKTAATTAAGASFVPADNKRSHSIRDVEFRRGKDGEARIIVSLSDPGAGVSFKQVGADLEVDFLATSLPANLARRMDVTDFATPASVIETFQRNGNTRMVIKQNAKTSHSAYQTGDQFIIEIAPVAQAVSGKAGQYGGEKISLDFYNVEVKDLIKVIAEFTGLNIVTSEKVGGTITLRLKDIPWDQALDIILTTKGLDKRELGTNVIWIAPRAEMAEMDKNDLENRQKISDLEELQTHMIRLNYLRADVAHGILYGQPIAGPQSTGQATCDLKQKPEIKSESGPTAISTASSPTAASRSILSKRGSASYDLKTNTLFVQDVAEKIEELRSTLASIDIPTKQVLIEARVVVADDGFSRNLGARLGFKGSLLSHNIGISSTANDAASIASGGLGGSTTVPFNIDLPATPSTGTAGTIGIALIEGAGNAILGLELQALESDKRGKIISSPRVVTENRQAAAILQGTQIPVVSPPATAGAAPTVEYKDAVLCLLVSPQILNNGDIILEVQVNKDAPGDRLFSGNSTIDTKRLKTQLRIKNGDTAVLGGIFEQEIRNETHKVPLLGDIPILGYLFKDNYKQDNKTELLIFLTPRVLPEGTVGLR